MKKQDAFKTELAWITDDDLRNFAEEAIKAIPEYFYSIPASSSGKYHSPTCCGRSGLVRHTKAAAMIAHSLFSVGLYDEMFSDREKQMIIISILLHDGFKSGKDGQAHTCAEHPNIMADEILKEYLSKNLNNQDEVQMMSKAIRSHMGIWNTSYKSKKEIMPKPQTKMEWFVHLADYLASRKYLEYKFEDDYFVLDHEDEDGCGELVKRIIKTSKGMLENGIDRDTILSIISSENGGKKNPNSITSKIVATNIIEKLKELSN